MSHGVGGIAGLRRANPAVDRTGDGSSIAALIMVVGRALAKRTNMLALFISMHWRGSDYSCLAK